MVILKSMVLYFISSQTSDPINNDERIPTFEREIIVTNTIEQGKQRDVKLQEGRDRGVRQVYPLVIDLGRKSYKVVDQVKI